MNEGTAILWIIFLFVLRFGLPVTLFFGSGYLVNAWLEFQARRERTA